MFSQTIDQASSLDQQYLDFAARTADVFAQYPQIEPLRYTIFRDLLVRQNSLEWKAIAKHWLRPIKRHSRTMLSSETADALIFIESRREVIVEALLPVYRELTSRNLKVGLVSFGGPLDLPTSALRMQFPASALPPRWASSAWAALTDEIEEVRHRSLRSSFYYSCANLKSLSGECDRILDALKPKIVLAASTQIIGGAAMIMAARARGIQTVLLQHGILQPFYLPLLADYLVTWGDSSNETLDHLGVSRQRLVALGSPRHDSMSPSTDDKARDMLLEELSLPIRPTFLFFSNGNDLRRNGVAPIECASWLESAAAHYSDDLNVVVRLHPNEDGSLYKDSRHLRVVKGSPDLATTLSGCDWVGSLCSTVLYDALIYKKPVWQFYADTWPLLADNWKSGLAERISSLPEFLEMTEGMLYGGAVKVVDKNLSDRVFANHGRAAEAVADFVGRQLEGEGVNLRI